ncbi:hypothetical protein GCM10009799_07470 [Nocardiopsis rhodophaea]|uniref:Secreted protein n=1 Tax=Nocardiopsis rhodophaea TaxID=280238 RepID=A0ABP5DQB0_9ACTN
MYIPAVIALRFAGWSMVIVAMASLTVRRRPGTASVMRMSLSVVVGGAGATPPRLHADLTVRGPPGSSTPRRLGAMGAGALGVDRCQSPLRAGWPGPPADETVRLGAPEKNALFTVLVGAASRYLDFD